MKRILSLGIVLALAAGGMAFAPKATEGARLPQTAKKSAKTAARAIKNAGGRRKRRYPSG